MRKFSLAAVELHRAGVTVRQVAAALGITPQAASLQLAGKRRLDPRLPAVVAALTDRETADVVERLASAARQ